MKNQVKPKLMKILIGIDTGTSTGIAIWNVELKKFRYLATKGIIGAMELVKRYNNNKDHELLSVYVEDARMVKFRTDPKKAQGAGSVKRDCSIWEEFLKENGIDANFVRPQKSLTKWKADKFNKYTGWTGKSSEHSRDAGLLVFGRKN